MLYSDDRCDSLKTLYQYDIRSHSENRNISNYLTKTRRRARWRSKQLLLEKSVTCSRISDPRSHCQHRRRATWADYSCCFDFMLFRRCDLDRNLWIDRSLSCTEMIENCSYVTKSTNRILLTSLLWFEASISKLSAILRLRESVPVVHTEFD
jgi:hypothetical protein